VQLLGILVTRFGLFLRLAARHQVLGPHLASYQTVVGAAVVAGPSTRWCAPVFTGGLFSFGADVFFGLALDRTCRLRSTPLQLQRYINTRVPQEVTGLSNRIRKGRHELQHAQAESEKAIEDAKATAQKGNR
jgi:hypothetical protein